MVDNRPVFVGNAICKVEDGVILAKCHIHADCFTDALDDFLKQIYEESGAQPESMLFERKV